MTTTYPNVVTYPIAGVDVRFTHQAVNDTIWLGGIENGTYTTLGSISTDPVYREGQLDYLTMDEFKQKLIEWANPLIKAFSNQSNIPPGDGNADDDLPLEQEINKMLNSFLVVDGALE